MEIISISILAAGTIGTLVAAFLVYKTLKSEHDWKRREYAQNIVKEWNDNTSKRWQIIEHSFPHLRDVDRTGGKVTELTKQQAKDIYTCEKTEATKWELRFSIVELLNYLEFVSLSYVQNVADKEIIDASLKDTMIKYHDMLKNVIDVVETCEGYPPWKPFSDLVSLWKSANKPIRKATA